MLPINIEHFLHYGVVFLDEFVNDITTLRAQRTNRQQVSCG